MNQVARNVHAHPLVLSTAQAIAREMWEVFLKDPKRGDLLLWRMKRKFPGLGTDELCERFVKQAVPGLLGEARATLARLLGATREKALQDSVHEALLMDATLRRGRVRV